MKTIFAILFTLSIVVLLFVIVNRIIDERGIDFYEFDGYWKATRRKTGQHGYGTSKYEALLDLFKQEKGLRE